MEVKKKFSRKEKISSKKSVRLLNEIKDILYDQDWTQTAPNLKLYFMERGVKRKGGLRYDLTMIPAKMLGKEFVKTKGNRNSDNYLELYTVVKGEALFLMQKMKGKKVEDAVAVIAKRGETIIDPPGYIIITINPSKKPLLIGNWIPDANKNIYKEIEDMKGACYFYTKNGWIKNKNYEIRSKKKLPELRFEKPLKKMPKNLNFLYGKNH